MSKLLAILLGLLAFALLCYLCITRHVPEILGTMNCADCHQCKCEYERQYRARFSIVQGGNKRWKSRFDGRFA